MIKEKNERVQEIDPDIMFKYGRYETPEYWKQITGFDGMYEISNFGRVGSWHGHGSAETTDTLRILNPSPKKGNGALRVFLTDPNDGKVKTRYVHLLVAKHFVPNPEYKPKVTHLDFDYSNNRWDNLKWVTGSELHKHMMLFDKTAIGAKGEKSLVSKLSKEEVLDIRKKYSHCVGRAEKFGERKTHQEIADEYNVSRSLIGLILNNKFWKRVK